MTVSTGQLVAWQRSAAMIPPGATIPVERDHLAAMCNELLELRALVNRLGTDLTTVAATARRQKNPPERRGGGRA